MADYLRETEVGWRKGEGLGELQVMAAWLFGSASPVEVGKACAIPKNSRYLLILSLRMRARRVLRSRPRISDALPFPLIFQFV